jgi:DHA3 family tetracycline resistance protein-like MFS transporter
MTNLVARGTTTPIWQAWINREIDSKTRATVLSMNGQMNAIGQIIGGPPLGWIGTVFGLRWAMFGVALLLAPTLLFFRLAQRWTQPAAVAATVER